MVYKFRSPVWRWLLSVWQVMDTGADSRIHYTVIVLSCVKGVVGLKDNLCGFVAGYTDVETLDGSDNFITLQVIVLDLGIFVSVNSLYA